MRFTLTVLTVFLLASCHQSEIQLAPKKTKVFEEFRTEPNTLAAIQERSRLRAIIYFQSMSYFIANGSQMGFEFALAEEFANWLGVELEIVIPPSAAAMTDWLDDGGGDLIITPQPLNRQLPPSLSTSTAYGVSTDVLVTRSQVEPLADLAAWKHRPIYTIRKSNQHQTLLQVAKTQNLQLNLKLLPEDHSDDELLDLLASGRIETAALEGRFAQTAIIARYPNLKIALEISEPTPIGWVLPAKSTALKLRLDQFLAIHYRQGEDGTPKASAFYNILYRKYYENPPLSRWHFPEHSASVNARVSNYDPMVQLVAQELGLDWRLLLAVMYEESKFDPAALSNAGAKGLMQLMPATFESLGFKKIYDTEENIRAGATYLKSLFRRFEKANLNDDEKVRFVLASYNAGAGHLEDARLLATKLGWKSDQWHGGVKQAMKLLSDEHYYSQVPHGYCRGGETTDYVARISERYSLFKKFLTI